MPIEVVNGSPGTIWTPLKDSATVYVGSLVTCDISAPAEGIEILPDAAGVFNETNNDMPLGVCIGTNRLTPLFNTTYKCEYITDPGATDAHDGASIQYYTQGDIWAKGDPIAMAKIALITPSTLLKASIFNAAVGTGPTVMTVTTGSSDGLGITTNATQFTPEAYPTATIYCRTGANAGAYRLLDAASSTVHTWDKAVRNDIAVGDTFVAVPMRFFGPSQIMFDGVSASFVDCADAPVLAGTNRWSVIVTRLDLAEAGKETVEFYFDAVHFSALATRA
ncbi:MAG: hypothetical protein ABIF11_05440 [Nitrospirota bacterium]